MKQKGDLIKDIQEALDEIEPQHKIPLGPRLEKMLLFVEDRFFQMEDEIERLEKRLHEIESIVNPPDESEGAII